MILSQLGHLFSTRKIPRLLWCLSPMVLEHLGHPCSARGLAPSSTSVASRAAPSHAWGVVYGEPGLGANTISWPKDCIFSGKSSEDS